MRYSDCQSKSEKKNKSMNPHTVSFSQTEKLPYRARKNVQMKKGEQNIYLYIYIYTHTLKPARESSQKKKNVIQNKE